MSRHPKLVDESRLRAGAGTLAATAAFIALGYSLAGVTPYGWAFLGAALGAGLCEAHRRWVVYTSADARDQAARP